MNSHSQSSGGTLWYNLYTCGILLAGLKKSKVASCLRLKLPQKSPYYLYTIRSSIRIDGNISIFIPILGSDRIVIWLLKRSIAVARSLESQ